MSIIYLQLFTAYLSLFRCSSFLTNNVCRSLMPVVLLINNYSLTDVEVVVCFFVEYTKTLR